jgi:hypothetical protein
MDAGDSVLPHHPLRGVVGDPDDDLQVRGLPRVRGRGRDQESDLEG